MLSKFSVNLKIRKSRKVIKEAFEKFGHRQTALAWAGGKDSTLLLWMARDTCKDLGFKMPRIIFVDEGDVFREIKKFSYEIIKKWNLDVDFIRNEDILAQVKRLGDKVIVKKLSRENQRELRRLEFEEKFFYFEPESYIGNHLMKTVPMNDYLKRNKIKALITGIRWDEHPSRAKETYFSGRKNPNHTRVHPVLHFKEADVWSAILTNNIPYSVLYKKGYRSLGASSSTTKAEKIPAWKQDLKVTRERAGRKQDKEKIMEKLRKLGYM